jgi:transposase
LCQRAANAASATWPETLTEINVLTWVKHAEINQSERPRLTQGERDQLTRLRRENRSLREDVEILKRATAFFAQEIR